LLPHGRAQALSYLEAHMMERPTKRGKVRKGNGTFVVIASRYRVYRCGLRLA